MRVNCVKKSINEFVSYGIKNYGFSFFILSSLFYISILHNTYFIQSRLMAYFFPNEDYNEYLNEEQLSSKFIIQGDNFFDPHPPLLNLSLYPKSKPSLETNSKTYLDEHQSENYPNNSSKTYTVGRNSELNPQKEEKFFFQDEEEGSHQRYLNENSINFQRYERSSEEIQELSSDKQYNLPTKKKKQQKNEKKGKEVKTRNMLQFFWKVLKNYFIFPKANKYDDGGVLQNQKAKVWKSVQNLNPSISSFTCLFKNEEMRKHLSGLFKSRYLMREIICSGINIDLKKVYIRYIKVLRKGFVKRQLHYLN